MAYYVLRLPKEKGIPLDAVCSKRRVQENVGVAESGLNVRRDGSHISDSQTRAELYDNFNVLIVAEKCQIGFDESMLHACYISVLELEEQQKNKVQDELIQYKAAHVHVMPEETSYG